MKIKRTEVAEAGITKRGRRKKIRLTRVDVALSTSEVRTLMQNLDRLRKEGRSRTGYHIHLSQDDTCGADRIEVTLFHEKTYSPHCLSETVVLDDE